MQVLHYTAYMIHRDIKSTISLMRLISLQAFQQFDTDGSGVVEVSTILSAIKFVNGPNMMGELGKSIRMLQACSLTPG